MAAAETLAENIYFPTDSLIKSDGPTDTQYFFDFTWQDLPEYLIPWHWMSSSNPSFPTNSSSSQTSYLPTLASEHYFHDEIAGGLMDEPSFGTTQPSPTSSKNQQSAGLSFPAPQTTAAKENTQSSTSNHHDDRASPKPVTIPDLTSHQSTPELPKRRKVGKKSVNRRLLCEKKDSQRRKTELDHAKSEQRMKVLERNRRAAAKCRDRKRVKANELTSQMEELQDRHQLLASCYNDLQENVSQLQSEILGHSDCKCTLIQQYIAKQAYKIVDNLTRQRFSSENRCTGITLTTTAPRPDDNDSSTSDQQGYFQGSSGLQHMAA